MLVRLKREQIRNESSCHSREVVVRDCVLSCPETIDPNRLHHVGLSLVNETSCGQKWGEGLIQDSHICSHPAGASSCLVTAIISCRCAQAAGSPSHPSLDSAGGFWSAPALSEARYLLPVWDGHLGQQVVRFRQTSCVLQNIPFSPVDL